MTELLESSFVSPARPTPQRRIWLSNIDLTQSNAHTPLLFFYRAHNDPIFFSPDKLRSSLSQVLTSFFPLAGRLVVGTAGRLEINCSGDGVPFVVARSNCTLHDLQNFVPSPEMRRAFVPHSALANEPLMLQITYLKCGGVVLGVAVQHICYDGRFFGYFLQKWSAVTRGAINPTSLPIIIDRARFQARSPPTILSYNTEYTRSSFSGNKMFKPSTTSILALDINQLNELKTRLSRPGARLSTFHVVASHVWRCICISRDLHLEPDREVQLALAFDLRQVMEPPLPEFFFGNAVVRVPVTSNVASLVSDRIKYGAEKIKEAMNRVNNEYVRSLVDYLETIEVGNLSKRSGLQETRICVVSWLGMPSYDVDFGWGKPFFVTRAEMYGAGFVYLIDRPKVQGGINVMVNLEVDCMERFKILFYDKTIRSMI